MNFFKIFFAIGFLSISSLALSQVKAYSPITSQSSGTSAFLDASGSPLSLPANTKLGKGLNFPRTNLSQFTFAQINGSSLNFPTGYDGMVVYNTANGATPATGAGVGGQSVTPGFYYFSNPTSTGASATGKWVRIGSEESVKAWALGGNATIQQATIGANNEVSGDYIGANDGNALVFATRGTVVDGGTTSTKNIARLVIGGEGTGNIIKEAMDGGTKQFDFALKVFGKARFTEGIVTSRSTYPDYVFDNYFTGKSEVNPSYQFMKLDEVEKFIKENNHLPGVTKIDDLSKDGEAYMVDVSETSIQTLEKVEELYLHVIEQQKQIKALKAEIAELKKK